MATPPISEEILRQTAEAYYACGGVIAVAARRAGAPENTFRNRLARAREAGLVGPNLTTVRASVTLNDDGSVHRTGLTQAIERPKFTPPPGLAPNRIAAHTDGEGGLIGQWSIFTKEAQTQAELIAAISEALADHRGAAPIAPAPVNLDDDLLTIYPVTDTHIGSLSWGAETGENWDLDIACKTTLAAASALVSRSQRTRHAVILGLGDYFHMNDRTNMTPRSGHILDVDGRWPKVFKAGARLALDLIRLVSERHEMVEVRFLAGNHDPDAAVTLSAALALYFDGHPRITVNDSASLHWYRRFGANLFGATHGHTMKPDRMAMMLAADRPEDWGLTKHRHFFFGHVHHESAKEIGAVRVESFNSPAAKDAHAHGAGWRAGRALNAITFHARHGEVGRHRQNLLSLEDAA